MYVVSEIVAFRSDSTAALKTNINSVLNPNLNINMNVIDIEFVSEMRCLGVVLDDIIFLKFFISGDNMFL